MIAHAIFFYFFSIIAILSAIMVVVSRNTVHAVFFLILDFISIGCLLYILNTSWQEEKKSCTLFIQKNSLENVDMHLYYLNN